VLTYLSIGIVDYEEKGGVSRSWSMGANDRETPLDDVRT